MQVSSDYICSKSFQPLTSYPVPNKQLVCTDPKSAYGEVKALEGGKRISTSIILLAQKHYAFASQSIAFGDSLQCQIHISSTFLPHLSHMPDFRAFCIINSMANHPSGHEKVNCFCKVSLKKSSSNVKSPNSYF